MSNDRLNGSSTSPRIHIGTHAQAMEFARCLSADFEQAHVAALTDSVGAIFDGATLTEEIHQIEHAVGFAMCISLALGSVTNAITLFSVVEQDVSALSPDHRSAYRRIGLLFDGWLDVRDWIVTDGMHYRSLAYSIDPANAWPNDPIRARETVLDSADPGYW
jgi:hypothetical protein